MFRGRAALVFLSVAWLQGCSSEDVADDGTSGSGGSSVVAASGTGGGGVSDGQATVEHYGYRFDLQSGAARSEVRLRSTEAGNCFALRSELPAESVTLGGVAASEVQLSDGSLRACGPFVDAGETTVFGADATVLEKTFLGLDVGFSRKTSMAGGTFSYLLSWVGGCEHFGPCDSH
ncbi:MAG: hypothetical protein VB934_14685, partial [Polyangiaceae bacterium]